MEPIESDILKINCYIKRRIEIWSLSMDDEKILLAEYQFFTESFWKNEQTGEKRVEFFITLATAIIAGIVALITRSGDNLSDESVRNIATGALLATLLFGLVTFLRMLQRNRVTDEYKGIINYLREQLKSRSVDLAEYNVPFQSHKRLIKGGLADTVALINSIVIGIISALWVIDEWGWFFIALMFLGTFILQVVLAKNDRKNKEREKGTSRAQTFRAGVGAIILNKNGKVLGLERKDIPGSWQVPQGGLEEESPYEAVIREIKEETGIEPEQLKLIMTGSRLLAYELPKEHRSQKTGRGQVHYWFLFKFAGDDEAITLGDKKEFRAWKWMLMNQLVAKVIDFKRPVYEDLAQEFKSYFSND